MVHVLLPPCAPKAAALVPHAPSLGVLHLWPSLLSVLFYFRCRYRCKRPRLRPHFLTAAPQAPLPMHVRNLAEGVIGVFCSPIRLSAISPLHTPPPFLPPHHPPRQPTSYLVDHTSNLPCSLYQCPVTVSCYFLCYTPSLGILVSYDSNSCDRLACRGRLGCCGGIVEA